MFASLIIVLSFVSVIPVPQKLIPDWNGKSLKFFCPMLALSGLMFSGFWFAFWEMLCGFTNLSQNLRGFVMTLLTLSLTGGLHLDGLMDTCDAIFSHRDRETRIKILSDTHAGSFAVIGCVIVILGKSLLFSELMKFDSNIAFIPVYSRFGMAVLLNNLPFAKSDGLAVILGSSRSHKHNLFFVIMMILLLAASITQSLLFAVILLFWRNMCIKIFGGITGDLLGAFVEICEVFMLMGLVIEKCI